MAERPAQRAMPIARRIHELAAEVGRDVLVVRVEEWLNEQEEAARRRKETLEQSKAAERRYVEIEQLRREHFTKIEGDPAWTDKNNPPKKNVVWDGMSLTDNGVQRTVEGYVPKNLVHKAVPTRDVEPMPGSGVEVCILGLNAEPMTRAGKYAVVCAVHDAANPTDRIIAVPAADRDNFENVKRALPYLVLVSRVKDWSNKHWDLAETYLMDVEADLAATGEQQGANGTNASKTPTTLPTVPAHAGGSGADGYVPNNGQFGYTFKKVGEIWRVQFVDEEGLFSPVDGMVYITHLLKNPGRRFSALEMKKLTATGELNTRKMLSGNSEEVLSGAVGVTGETSEPMMDQEATDACEKRLREISQEQDAAREAGDTQRLEELEDEQRRIEKYLKSGTNIRGKPRPLDGRQRSTFVTVKKAIDLARISHRGERPMSLGGLP